MSPECSKRVERWNNKYIERKCALGWLLTRITNSLCNNVLERTTPWPMLWSTFFYIFLLLLLSSSSSSFSWFDSPSAPKATLSGSSITLRHTTLHGNPLDKWSARLFDNTQHSPETCVHVPSEIRTCNPNYRATVDCNLCLLNILPLLRAIYATCETDVFKQPDIRSLTFINYSARYYGYIRQFVKHIST